MIAKEVLSGFLIIGGRPISGVVLEIGSIGIRKVGSAAEDVIIDGRQIVAGGKHIVQVPVVVVVIVAAVVAIVIRRLVAILTVVIRILIVGLILTVILILIVGPAIVAPVSKIAETAAVAKIVAHRSLNDGCFPVVPLSTGWSKNSILSMEDR